MMVDASQYADRAVVQQMTVDGNHLAIFQKYITNCDREMYLAVQNFRHFVEGRSFVIFTDHKPLTFSFHLAFGFC